MPAFLLDLKSRIIFPDSLNIVLGFCMQDYQPHLGPINRVWAAVLWEDSPSLTCMKGQLSCEICSRGKVHSSLRLYMGLEVNINQICT